MEGHRNMTLTACWSWRDMRYDFKLCSIHLQPASRSYPGAVWWLRSTLNACPCTTPTLCLRRLRLRGFQPTRDPRTHRHKLKLSGGRTDMLDITPFERRHW